MLYTKEKQEEPIYSIDADFIEDNQNVEKESSSFIKTTLRRLREHSGVWYMMIASFIFVCCTFSLKLIPADMFDIMIARFLVQSTIFGVFASFHKRYNVFQSNGQPIACLLNILMSSGTNLTYIASLYFIPLSDLNTIKYTYIVWAAILSVIFLKDRFKTVNGIALGFTFIGLIFATKPQVFVKAIVNMFDKTSPSLIFNMTISNITSNTDVTITSTASPYYYLGIGLASLSALTKAVQMIARKQLIKTKLPHSVMNFQFTSTALLVSLSYSIIRRFWQPGPYPWKWMGTAGVMIGLCQLLSNTFLAKAIKRESVQLLAILGSLDIVYAVILQYIFFRQTKPWIFFVGASLIVVSAVILSVDRYLANKRERKQFEVNNKNRLIVNDT